MTAARLHPRSERAVRVRILGDICIDGQPIASSRIRALLVRLALSPGDIVSEGSLMEAIWSDGPPKSARTALQTHIGALRDLLEPERERRTDGTYLFRRYGGYMLDLGDDLDVSALRRGVERAEPIRSTQPAVAASLLDSTLELWHPNPLCEFGDAPWATGHAATLDEYASRALILRMELALESEDHAEAIPRLEAAVARRPYDEQLVALLMAALHRSGRQADALAAFQQARSRLVEDLGVEPGPGLREAEREVLAHSGAVSRKSQRRPIFDDSSYFVGRVKLQAELRRHLSERALVTLVGPGGVGKSRLARRVVSALGPEWGIDTVFIDLSEIDAGQAASTIATQLGVVVHPRLELTDAIAAAIEHQETLLVLDTCEHVLDDVAHVVDALLARNPDLRILATSRSPLNHRHEVVVEVEPLAVDDAISLLLDRAGMSQVDETDRIALGEVCRRLDGLPLAIELAAGRLRTLTPKQFSKLLERGHAELRGGEDRPFRHRSLTETIAWSYELLDEGEKRVLRELSTLRGTFTEQIIAGFRPDDETLAHTLLHLVDRSLIARSDDQSLEFRTLDTVREFALAQADALGERDEIEDHHASWVARSIIKHTFGGDGPSPHELASEIAPAVDFLHRNDRSEELPLVMLLGTWWIESSRIAEGRARIEAALRHHPGAPSEQVLAGHALIGMLAWYQGDGRSARAALDQVMPRVDELGQAWFIAMTRVCSAFIDADFEAAAAACTDMLASTPDTHDRRLLALFTAGNVAHYAGDDERALGYYLELRSQAEARNDSYQTALALRFQALATALCDDIDRGWALAERAKAAADAQGGLVGRSQAEAILGFVAYLARDQELALQHATAAARLSRASLDAFALRVSLPVAAGCLAESGEPHLAATCLGWTRHLVDDSQLFLPPAVAALATTVQARLRDELGEPTQRRLFAQAAGTSLGDIVEGLREAS